MSSLDIKRALNIIIISIIIIITPTITKTTFSPLPTPVVKV